MDSTPVANASAVPKRSRVPGIILRILCILLIGWTVGNLTSGLEAWTARQPGQGGFGRGILHGILMPFALPNLLVGQDVNIYQSDNTGRTYRLGFTLGVNSCGFIFFGYFFWRLNRLRKLLRQNK